MRDLRQNHNPRFSGVGKGNAAGNECPELSRLKRTFSYSGFVIVTKKTRGHGRAYNTVRQAALFF